MNLGDTFAQGESGHPEWDFMYRNGLTAEQIAKVCGARSQSVGRHLRVERARFSEMQVEHESNRPLAKPRTTRLSWDAKLQSLSVIWAAEGRYPSSSDRDPRRRRLGY